MSYRPGEREHLIHLQPLITHAPVSASLVLQCRNCQVVFNSCSAAINVSVILPFFIIKLWWLVLCVRHRVFHCQCFQISWIVVGNKHFFTGMQKVIPVEDTTKQVQGTLETRIWCFIQYFLLILFISSRFEFSIMMWIICYAYSTFYFKLISWYNIDQQLQDT